MFFKKYKWALLTTTLGAITGYLYWYFYGCVNGCTITGSPINSTLYFAFLDFLIPGIFKQNKSEIPVKVKVEE